MRLFLLAILACPWLVAAEEPDPFFLEGVLPEDTLLYVAIPNGEDVSREFQGSSLKKLLDHPEMRTFLEPIEAYVEKRKKERGRPDLFGDEMWKEMTGLTIDEILALAKGPVNFAIVDLPVNEEHTLDVVLSVGNADPEKLKDATAKVMGLLEARSEFTVQGVTVQAFGNRDVTIYAASVGKTWVFATQEERIRQILESHASGKGAYRSHRGAVVGKLHPFFYAQVNAPAVLHRFRRELGDRGLLTMEKLGLTDVTGLAAMLAFDGANVRERYWIGTSSRERGIPRLLTGKPRPDPALKDVPEGALSYGRLDLDVVALFDVATSALPEDFHEQRAEFEQRVGFRLREDLLASVGSSWTFQDDITSVDLRDAAKFQECLKKLFAYLKIEVRESDGLFAMTIPTDRHPDLDEPSVPLAWRIRDGRLHLSLSPQALKRTRSGKSLDEDATYRAARGRLPAEADAVLYMDLGRMFTWAYNTAEPFAHFFREMARDDFGEAFLDLARLPMGETLGGFIGATCTIKRTEADAIWIESVSSIGITPVSMTILAGGAAAAYYALFEMRRGRGGTAENERIAQIRLQWIAQAQETFKSSDSDGNLVGDYWTRDVAGLYALKNTSGQFIYLIDPQTAGADSEGGTNYDALQGKLQSLNGYWFRALTTDPDGDPYQKDPDGDGKTTTNKTRFGVCAYPAAYGGTGRLTFLVSEDGRLWKKDTRGEAPDAWPGKDPSKQGWLPAE